MSTFGPEVVSISLFSACIMRFRELARPRIRVDQLLEPRRVVAITGPARTEWTHEIPGHTIRAQRLSVTFRTVTR
ncbi:MAG: alpha-ketoglutarate-dependent dioxygenase AlkB [Acidobacteria bacterium]|nr:alpha-ketoglutarate-dependent dioxygenase AlkB [Acidobacteriota bacterium]